MELRLIKHQSIFISISSQPEQTKKSMKCIFITITLTNTYKILILTHETRFYLADNAYQTGWLRGASHEIRTDNKIFNKGI